MKEFYHFGFLLVIIFGCGKSPTTVSGPIPPVDSSKNVAFAKGADVSWITQMENAGRKFYSKDDTQQDIFQILKNEGINSIRLRVWVHPTVDYNNITDVVNKAIRAKNAGMRIMIDFHYSDTWADPGHQTEPAAWSGQNISALVDSVYNHTQLVLATLKTNAVIPEWVQVGNETNDGMLWPEGKASANMQNFSLLVNAGYNAVKSVDTSIKVIVHISNGYDNGLFRWMFDGLTANNAKWDIIGMSLYPSASDWNTLNAQCLLNMNDMVARYGKPVMICEVGMSWTDSTACNSFISDIVTKTKSVTNGNGLGVFYWEPEAYNNWQGYTPGAFDNSGKPTRALDAFK